MNDNQLMNQIGEILLNLVMGYLLLLVFMTKKEKERKKAMMKMMKDENENWGDKIIFYNVPGGYYIILSK